MDTVNWVILYLFLPLAIGILGNLSTPWVKTLLVKGNLSLRERRIASLKKEYSRMLRYFATPSLLTHYLIINIGLLILVVLGGGVIGGLLLVFILLELAYFGGDYSDVFNMINFAGGGSSVFLAFGYYLFIETGIMRKRIFYFDRYREKTIKKLIKLGGNPEEIVEIDKEVENKKSPF